MARSLFLRTVVPVLVALGVASAFVRLGFWQLDRLRERRVRNAVVEERLAAPPAPLGALARDSEFARYRRVQLRGRYDFANELVLAGRSRNGSPGVHILTPLRLSGDTVVLVNRGWVYSPDGVKANFARWREPESADVTGFVEPLASPTVDGHARPSSTQSNVIRSLTFRSVSSHLPYPVLPLLVVQEAAVPPGDRRLRDFGADTTTPVRLPAPPLGEGSHKSYALQWFAFALMALAGAGMLVRMEMTRRGNRGLAEPRAAS